MSAPSAVHTLKARRNGIQRSLVEIDKHVDAGRDRGHLRALTTHYRFPHSTERGCGGQVPLGSVFFLFTGTAILAAGRLRVNNRNMEFARRRVAAVTEEGAASVQKTAGDHAACFESRDAGQLTFWLK